MKHWLVLLCVFFSFFNSIQSVDEWGINEENIIEVGDQRFGTFKGGEHHVYRIPPRKPNGQGSIMLNITLLSHDPLSFIQVEIEHSSQVSQRNRQSILLTKENIVPPTPSSVPTDDDSFPFILKTILPSIRSSSVVHISGSPFSNYALEVHEVDNIIYLDQPIDGRASLALPLYVYLDLPVVTSRLPGQVLEIIVHSPTDQIAFVRAKRGEQDGFFDVSEDATILSTTAAKQTMSTLAVLRFLLNQMPDYGSGRYVIQIIPRSDSSSIFDSKPFNLTARITPPIYDHLYPLLFPIIISIILSFIFLFFFFGISNSNLMVVFKPLTCSPIPFKEAIETKDRLVTHRVPIFLRHISTVATVLYQTLPLDIGYWFYFLTHFPQESGKADGRWTIFRRAFLIHIALACSIFLIYIINALWFSLMGVNHQTMGEHDKCYFNYLCIWQLGYLWSFNNIISNIPMTIGGILIFFATLRSEWNFLLEYRLLEKAVMDGKLPVSNSGHFVCIHKNTTINDLETVLKSRRIDFQYLYLWALLQISQSLVSVLYHLCVLALYFQIDTLLMYILLLLSMFHFYFRYSDRSIIGHKHHDLLTDHSNKTFIKRNISNKFHDVEFWIFMTGCAFLIIMNTANYNPPYENIVNGFCSILVGFIILRVLRHFYYIVKEKRIGQSKSAIIFGGCFLLVIGYAFYNWGVYGMATSIFLLNCLGSQGFFYFSYNVWRAKRLGMHTVYYCIMIGFGIGAFYVYRISESDKLLTPWGSRELNRACVLLGVYGSHSVWHIFAAGGLTCYCLVCIKRFEADEICLCVHCLSYERKKDFCLSSSLLERLNGLFISHPPSTPSFSSS